MKYTDPTGEFTVDEKFDERPQFFKYTSFIKYFNKVVDNNTFSFYNDLWGRSTSVDFGKVLNAFGGYTFAQKFNDNKESENNIDYNGPRYIYTKRAGLIDMRHFFQFAYISSVTTNDFATNQGYKHEDTAEADSAFAPVDLVSNALGAYFGAKYLSTNPEKLKASLNEFLLKLEPVDSLGKQYKEVIEFYSSRKEDGTPKNQNFTAEPIYHDKDFPFELKANSLSIKKEKETSNLTSILKIASSKGTANPKILSYSINK